MKQSKTFQFHGGVSSYIGVGITSFLLILVTLGLGLPWAITMHQRWKTNNTSINGRRLSFNGSGLGLFGNWIKWWILTIITFGIYFLWVGPALQKWIVENTDFVE